MSEPPDGHPKDINELPLSYSHWLVIVAVFYLASVWGLYVLYGDKVHLALPLIASAVIIVSIIINFKWKNPEDRSGRTTTYILFILSLMLSFMIYALPNIKMATELSQKLQPYSHKNQALETCRSGGLAVFEMDLAPEPKEFIKEQYKTAVAEIAKRIEIDNYWFHNKFILVGALFAAFVTFISPLFNPDSEKEQARQDQSREVNGWPIWEQNISRMFKTPLPSSVLGMACIVSFAIDLHMRNNMIMTQKLGLWIRDFVECLVIPEGAYIGWEKFLRIDMNIDGKNIEGMHVQVLFDMLDASHFFFTSIVLYSLYIFCLLFYFHVCGSSVKNRFDSVPVIVLILILVQATLFLVAIGGNSFPSTLEVKPFFSSVWLQEEWFPGGTGGMIPFMTGLLVSYLISMRFVTLYYVCKGQ